MNYYVPQDGEDGVMLQELIQQKNAGVEPKAGDLALYIPWGNIAVFCEDFR